MEVEILAQPNDEEFRLGDFIKTQLTNDKWKGFKSATAFLKKSGIQHIHTELKAFVENNEVRMIAGVDLGGTSIEAINLLRDALKEKGELWVFHNENNSTFHPKLYAFYNEDEAAIAIGSGNLTEGGLFTNYELSVALYLNLGSDNDAQVFNNVIEIIDCWSVNAGDNAKLLKEDVLADLIENDYLLPEKTISKNIAASKVRAIEEPKPKEKKSIFKPVAVPSAPKVELEVADLPDLDDDEFEVPEIPAVDAQAGEYNIFLMTLQKTDVGVGQTTAGKSRRSPEIFIPLSARNHDPEFWGWSDLFSEDAEKPGKFDRMAVPIRIGGEIVEVNMMTWPDKSDFRLRSEAIRSAGNIGDILKLERCDGQNGYQYLIEIIPTDSSSFKSYDSKCNIPVKGKSLKRWAYYNE